MSELAAPFIGINRHRLATDGKGVTTLVAFSGCPLRCKYCLNDQCHDPERIVATLSPQQLLDQVMVDNLYFLATGGGICFGGGEPLLHSEFIHQFCSMKVAEWRISLETSLNVPRHHLERVAGDIDHYYIDIKDLDPVIYHDYTGCDNAPMLANLQWLLRLGGMPQRITVRLPHIPNHNTAADIEQSRKKLVEMGITHFDEFNYIIR